MGRTPSRTDKKTSKPRGENGKKPQSLTEKINEQVNAAEEKVQEIEERDKPKQENFSSDKSEDSLDFSEKDKSETMKFILERFPNRPVKGPIPRMHLSYGSSKGHQAELAEKRKLREAWNNTLAEESKNSVKPEKQQEEVKDENESTKEATTTVDPEKLLKQLEEAKKKIDELSKTNQSLRSDNSILNESIKQRAEEDARKSQETKEEPKGEEPKAANSENFEETVTSEAGEAKVEGEPKVNTEQAQATQEPKKEANARPGTGEATKDNVMSPEDAFKFFNDKKNYERASTVFKTPSFDRYIDSATGKWIPRSYFDAFNARDGINPKKFTFEHFKAKIPEDPGKQLTPEEETADIYNKNKAEEDYKKEYEKFNTGFKTYLRKHPKLEKIVKTGEIAGGVSILYGIGQMLYDAYISGQNDKDEVQDIAKRLNDDDPEPLVGNVNNNSTEDITNKLKDADASTKTPEDNSGTIEQAIAEQAPAGNVEPEKSQVAANAATPTNTKANNAPASTAKSAPTKDTTQGLPPVVTRDAPPANTGSSDMPNNPNKPNDVTAALANAMKLANSVNPEPQAGSDAIGYGDLYDQNFIDYWAKRNPNLAFGVSQGRR